MQKESHGSHREFCMVAKQGPAISDLNKRFSSDYVEGEKGHVPVVLRHKWNFVHMAISIVTRRWNLGRQKEGQNIRRRYMQTPWEPNAKEKVWSKGFNIDETIWRRRRAALDERT